MAEDEMVRQHHLLNGHESVQIWEIMKDSGAWHVTVYEAATQQLNNTTTLLLPGEGEIHDYLISMC